MKDWDVFVVLGVLSFIMVDFVILNDGSLMVRAVRVLIEVITQVG